MVSELLEKLDPSVCAEIALVLFFLVFLSVSVRTYFTRRETVERQAEIPLSDGTRR